MFHFLQYGENPRPTWYFKVKYNMQNNEVHFCLSFSRCDNKLRMAYCDIWYDTWSTWVSPRSDFFTSFHKLWLAWKITLFYPTLLADFCRVLCIFFQCHISIRGTTNFPKVLTWLRREKIIKNVPRFRVMRSQRVFLQKGQSSSNY